MKFKVKILKESYTLEGEDEDAIKALKDLGFTFTSCESLSHNLVAIDENIIVKEITSIDNLKELSRVFDSELIIKFYNESTNNVDGVVTIFNGFLD